MAWVRVCDRCCRVIGNEKYVLLTVAMVITTDGAQETEQTPELCIECTQKLRKFLVPATAASEAA